MKHLALASIALALSALPALADLPQDAASAAALGQVDFTYNRSRPTPSAAERTPLQAKGVKLRDTILATPALRDRRGFALHASVVLEQPVASRVGDPDMVWGGVISRRINVTRSQPDAAGRYPGDGEGPVLRYMINKTDKALGADDSGFFTLPEQRQEGGGILRFTRAGNAYTIITPAGLPGFVPVSIGEYLGATAAQLEKAGSPDQAAEMRQGLAGLAPGARTAPYCMTRAAPTANLSGRCAEPGARPMMRVNPALGAGAGAASKARVIVLIVPQLGTIGDAQERRRLIAAASQLDMTALQAMLGGAEGRGV